jgi:hypothetical protein
VAIQKGEIVLNAVSCWTVDWEAISAIATAAACIVALYVADKERRLRKRREASTFVRLSILLKMELGILEVLHQLLQEEDSTLEKVRLKGPPESRDFLQKVLAAPNLRAALEQGDQFSIELIKCISALVMVLDGFVILFTSSAISTNEKSSTPVNASALRTALDNLRSALEVESELHRY